jgi:Xaa-Pro aminopeptidase
MSSISGPVTEAGLRATECAAKVTRLVELLDRRGADRLVVTAAENLSWLFGGARVTVPYGGSPVFQATVSRSGEVRVLAPENEAARLRAEELPGVDVVAIPWHAPFPDAPRGAVLDTALAVELRVARASLLSVELDRYRALGSDLATAVTAVLRSVGPQDAERRVAAEIVRAVVEIGAEPVVVLVGGASRRTVRHPLPTTAPLGARALVVVGARRHGLIASLSRWVRFASTADDALDAALREVEADAYAATVPGRPLGEILAEIAAAYPRHGLPVDAWLGHHQGGPTGYLGRDPKVVPGTQDVVRTDQAFAWNPSVPGAKLEDTVIVRAEGNEVLTVDPGWPVIDVRGIPRPLPLDLG